MDIGPERQRTRERQARSAAKYKLVGYRPAGSLSSCCHGDAQVNLTWANSHRHTDARYAIPLFIWFLHSGTYFVDDRSSTAVNTTSWDTLWTESHQRHNVRIIPLEEFFFHSFSTLLTWYSFSGHL